MTPGTGPAPPAIPRPLPARPTAPSRQPRAAVTTGARVAVGETAEAEAEAAAAVGTAATTEAGTEADRGLESHLEGRAMDAEM